MKKAALYARVSSALQEKERTIESQLEELRKQIAEAGDVLVKEYVDDGYSGARLDRPALDEMRGELKTGLFDSVYFLNADRIAREVTYQTIVISEILKHRKQIIINGQDYVHNPENKFSLTVLGAVAELERAKIAERMTRGQQHRLQQGFLLGCGHNVYGYDYVKKTEKAPPAYVINEREAEAIRYAFETYAEGNVGIQQISRRLEEMDAPRKRGGRHWGVSKLKCILKNETYLGVKYFNKMRCVREYANPLFGTKKSSRKLSARPREEWIGIPVPQIVPKKLFDKVREKFEWNKGHYRNPRRPQLLSGLVRCGSCGRSFFAYRRHYLDRRFNEEGRAVHRRAYKCGWRHAMVQHSKTAELERCLNREVRAELLEGKVMEMVREVMAEPSRLTACLELFNEKDKPTRLKMEKQLREMEAKAQRLAKEKERILDLYARGSLDRGRYAKKSLWYDNEINRAKAERDELVGKIPILHKKGVVEASVREYCRSVRDRIGECRDFESQRHFLLDYIDKVVYLNDHVSILGHVPVKLVAYEDPNQPSEVGRIGFSIKGKINRRSK